jgi:hypothetical protein
MNFQDLILYSMPKSVNVFMKMYQCMNINKPISDLILALNPLCFFFSIVLYTAENSAGGDYTA